MAACSLSVSEAHRIRLGALRRLCRSGGYAAASAVRFPAAGRPGRRQDEHGGPFHQRADSRRFRSMSRCLARQPRCSLRGPLPSRRSPSRSLGPDAPLGEGNPLKFDQTPLFPRCSLIPFRTSSRTPTRASPKRLRILRAPNFQIVDDLDAILAKLAGVAIDPSARTLITAWIDDRRSRGRPPGAPENHVARGT